MRQIAVVTTFNFRGLQEYGQKMIDGFIKNWPQEVKLYVYAEDCEPVVTDTSRVEVLDFNTVSPELVAFKTKWKDVPKANGDVSKDPVRSKRKDAGKGFKWDAIRFSHKVYSIFHCAKYCNADVLVWMDADMICHSKIDIETLSNMVKEDMDICYIGRERKWPECGLYSINLHSKGGKAFLKEFQRVYDEAENGIFQMAEWHDSYVFHIVTGNMKKLKMHNWAAGLVKGEGHPLINSPWGAYLDHLKGARKRLGKSKPVDLLQPRTEKYWNWRNV